MFLSLMNFILERMRSVCMFVTFEGLLTDEFRGFRLELLYSEIRVIMLRLFRG